MIVYLILKEMIDLICLDLVAKKLITDSVTIYVGYSNSLNIKGAKGTAHIPCKTNSDSMILPEVIKLYDKIVNPDYPVRRIMITCNRVSEDLGAMQLTLFEDVNKTSVIQETVLKIKTKYGKNSILKGMNFLAPATTRERNRQIGGHKSGD